MVLQAFINNWVLKGFSGASFPFSTVRLVAMNSLPSYNKFLYISAFLATSLKLLWGQSGLANLYSCHAWWWPFIGTGPLHLAKHIQWSHRGAHSHRYPQWLIAAKYLNRALEFKAEVSSNLKEETWKKCGSKSLYLLVTFLQYFLI